MYHFLWFKFLKTFIFAGYFVPQEQETQFSPSSKETGTMQEQQPLISRLVEKISHSSALLSSVVKFRERRDWCRATFLVTSFHRSPVKMAENHAAIMAEWQYKIVVSQSKMSSVRMVDTTTESSSDPSCSSCAKMKEVCQHVNKPIYCRNILHLSTFSLRSCTHWNIETTVYYILWEY